MGQREFIVSIIIAVVILLVILDIFSRLKLKETVRSKWGTRIGTVDPFEYFEHIQVIPSKIVDFAIP